MIFLYNVDKNFKPIRKLKGHSSTIWHIDFAEDGEILKSVCQAYEILFFSVREKRNIGSGASSFKDEMWVTNTARLGWHQQGIWPPFADGSDINSCDRSSNYKVLATADDFGFVKLFRYPCPVEKANYHKYNGHSSHVTKVRFHTQCQYLISAGGNDKALFQWKFQMDDEAQEDRENSKEEEEDADMEGAEDGDENIGLFEEEEVDEGDQRLCVDPFKGEVDNSWPSNIDEIKNKGEQPDQNLKLKYAHGFRSFDTRNNLKYTSDNKIAFTTAALGIVLDPDTNTQQFFNEHGDDIVSMDIHPDGDIIATGQMAQRGKAKLVDIRVWSTKDFSCFAQLKGFHQRAIRQIKFSPSGKKLLSTGEDDDHSVAVYDWRKKSLLCTGKVDRSKVTSATWISENEFITCGVRHVKFWTQKGTRLDNKRALYGKLGQIPILDITKFNGKIYSTTSKGKLAIWSGRNYSKSISLNSEKKAAWCIHSNSTHLITGDDLGNIIFWNSSLKQDYHIKMSSFTDSAAVGIRSFCWNEETQRLLVGTRGAEIFEIDPENTADTKCFMHGHYNGEVWGCAVHPTEQLFASCGGDKTIRIWNSNSMIKASQEF